MNSSGLDVINLLKGKMIMEQTHRITALFAEKTALEDKINSQIKQLKAEKASKIRQIDEAIEAELSHEIDRVMELLLIPINYSSYHIFFGKKKFKDISKELLNEIDHFIYNIGYMPDLVIHERSEFCRNDIKIKQIDFNEKGDDCIITFYIVILDQELCFKRSSLIDPDKFKQIVKVVKSVQIKV